MSRPSPGRQSETMYAPVRPQRKPAMLVPANLGLNLQRAHRRPARPQRAAACSRRAC